MGNQIKEPLNEPQTVDGVILYQESNSVKLRTARNYSDLISLNICTAANCMEREFSGSNPVMFHCVWHCSHTHPDHH